MPEQKCKPFTDECRDCTNQVPCWAQARHRLATYEELQERLHTAEAFVVDLIAETRRLRGEQE